MAYLHFIYQAQPGKPPLNTAAHLPLAVHTVRTDILLLPHVIVFNNYVSCKRFKSRPVHDVS